MKLIRKKDFENGKDFTENFNVSESYSCFMAIQKWSLPPRSGIEFRGDNEGCVTELSGFKNNILS